MTKSALQTGESVVSAAYGRRFLIDLPDGQTMKARPRGKNLRLVCGDRVETESLAGESEQLVTARLPRQNALQRTNSRGQPETLAANLDHIIVVIAPEPRPDPFVIDRLLGVAPLIDCQTTLVCNKSDIDTCENLTATYKAIGYKTLTTSTKNLAGLDELAQRIEQQTAVLIGQSGVGKSSLTNAIAPAAKLKTAELGRSSNEGRHTTVAAHRLAVNPGTYLIDSPGVRDFAPYIASQPDVINAFPELAALGTECRFHNCLHFREPACAVIEAAADDSNLDRRYQSYRRLLNIVRQTTNMR